MIEDPGVECKDESNSEDNPNKNSETDNQSMSTESLTTNMIKMQNYEESNCTVCKLDCETAVLVGDKQVDMIKESVLDNANNRYSKNVDNSTVENKEYSDQTTVCDKSHILKCSECLHDML